MLWRMQHYDQTKDYFWRQRNIHHHLESKGPTLFHYITVFWQYVPLLCQRYHQKKGSLTSLTCFTLQTLCDVTKSPDTCVTGYGGSNSSQGHNNYAIMKMTETLDLKNQNHEKKKCSKEPEYIFAIKMLWKCARR